MCHESIPTLAAGRAAPWHLQIVKRATPRYTRLVSERAHDVDRLFTEETSRLTAERLPLGGLTLLLVFAVAWLFEHAAHPERDSYYAIVYAGEALCLGTAIALVRRPTWRTHSRAVAVTTLVALIGCVTLYHIFVTGESAVLAMALLYMLSGAMVLLPWGWQGQLPVALSAVTLYGVAVAKGVTVTSQLPMEVLGITTISGLSVGGAAFMSQQRRRFLEQAAELRAANAALAQANEAKNQFLAGVSHELRTPLNIIVGYTDLLLERHFGVLPDAAIEALEAVARNTRTLVYLINDLLDLARIEAGRLAVSLARVELPPVFAQLLRFVESKLDGRPVHFHSQAPAGIAVIADRERLEQILVNLLSNAAKFTARGDIRLVATRQPDDMVAIEVHDTGVGIDAHEIAAMFQPFSQGAMGRKLGGVGIGLSISARLAHAMGGELSVRSEVGAGSTFTLRLPAAAGPA